MINVHSIETFATQDGPGIRLVVFLQGCMFKCLYCHNPDTIPFENPTAKLMSAEDILALANKQKGYFGKNGGITFSGWEPLIQAKELLPIVKKLKSEWFHVCIDTNCFIQTPEAREVLALADLILPDIKQIHAIKHLKLVGQKNDNTFKTLAYLEEIQKPYWLRYVLVPWYSNDAEDLHELGKFIATLKSMVRIELLPYHNLGKEKREKMGRKYPLEGLPAATRVDLEAAKAILEQYTDKILLRG